MREELFKKALRVVAIELEEELLHTPTAFLEALWDEIRYELRRLAGDVEIAWNLNKFIERVREETERRKVDLKKFRNGKGEPISNLFKRLIREVAKESNIILSNDALSRLLNFVRNQYSTGGTLVGALYPARAFYFREEYNIVDYYTTGDDNSCFRAGGCNEGSALWLVKEDEEFDRAKFVVFHYKSSSGNKEGWGRCWAYKVSDRAIFSTNFYSKGFDIKAQWLKHALVKVLRSLFDLSENVRFAINKNICLPIYLNGDGIIIYEKDSYESSYEIIELSKRIQSQCMHCNALVKLEELRRFQEELNHVQGAIICSDCYEYFSNLETCEGCGERFYRDDMYYQDNAFWCESCYAERFTECEICGEVYPRDVMIVDREGYWLCPRCAHAHRRHCVACGEWVYPDEGANYDVLIVHIGVERGFVCTKCQQYLVELKCEKCGREFHYLAEDYLRDADVREMVRLGLCYECFRAHHRRIRREIFDNELQPSLPFNPIDELLI